MAGEDLAFIYVRLLLLTLVVKPPSQSTLFPIMQKFRNQKSFLLATVEGDRKTNGGSGTGKRAMPNIQNSIKSN